MSDRPAASIVVNNFNYAAFVGQAIDSALRQTCPAVEVVVVDDGSTDGSRDVIEGYGRSVRAVFKPNGGQGSAFNAGFEASRGDVILFLDADDLLEPTAVERALQRFDSDAVAKVHWPMRLIDASGQLTGGMLPKSGELPEGCFRDVLIEIGPDSYQSVPASGNAWSRGVLEKVLPIREPDAYRQGADGYLLTVTPLWGQVRRVSDPQSRYRVHGRNQYWCDVVDERIDRSIARYERRSQTLAEHLRRLGVKPQPQRWKTSNPYYRWMSEIQQTARELKSVIPPDSRFIFVDAGQWGGQPLTGRLALPFTERDGTYWGPPADGPAAVLELERLVGQGAQFIAFVRDTFWWLEHYPALRQQLNNAWRCVMRNERAAVFRLER